MMLFSPFISPHVILFLQGHSWVGLDISSAMLGVANERELEGDLACGDLGEGLPFRWRGGDLIDSSFNHCLP